jgi:hypothetical protein
LPSRFRWPETREQWEHYQHNPHSAVLQALAQAKAVLAAKECGMTNEAKEQAA